MSEDDAERLRSVFESVTGRTSVVETQREDSGSRDVDAAAADGVVGPAEHHGLEDAIDDPEAVEAP